MSELFNLPRCSLRRHVRGGLFAASALVVSFGAVPFATPAWAGTSYTTLYSFDGAGGGYIPNQITGYQSNPGNPGTWAIFGTTQYGGMLSGDNCAGNGGCGLVFKLAPPNAGSSTWRASTLYRFQGGADGAQPQAGVIFNGAGTMYGTTTRGSVSSNGEANGTVFNLTPPAGTGNWTEAVIHGFTGSPDASDPFAAVTLTSTGTLVGTSFQGGKKGGGTVFSLTPPASGTVWNETLLRSFQGFTGGGDPESSLISGATGALYGTVTMGAVHFQGAIFRVAPAETGHAARRTTLLHSFSGKDGSSPEASLIEDSSGALYGTASGGGANFYGTVFKLSPPASGTGSWKMTVLYSFTGGADGGIAASPLVADASGALYGVTSIGGNLSCGEGSGCGVVFKLTPPATGKGPWTETVLHSFAGGADGAMAGNALGMGLIFDSAGTLYGSTPYGGGNNAGTVFAITQ